MPTISRPEPPPPFCCAVCSRPDNVSKAGPSCVTCPAFKDTHFFPNSAGDDHADIVIVGDVPTVPRLMVIGGREIPDSSLFHASFRDDGSKVLQRAIQDVQKDRPSFDALRFRYIYGVKCAVDKPNKDMIASCRTPLKTEINRLVLRRAANGGEKSITVIACGLTALHSLGVPAKSERDATGRVFDNVPFGDAMLTVVFTRSLKAIAGAVGKYSSVLADVERAMRIATKAEIRVLPREEVEKDYVYPETIEEVRSLIKLIANYTGHEDVAPKDWPISFDTETNTLHPFEDRLQVVAASFAWDTGRAATIMLWHPETKYDPQEAWNLIVELINTFKPLVGHGLKYDQKVMWKMGFPQGPIGNTKWDTLSGEHTLEEDKKNHYSLKRITAERHPELAGYQDRLHDELEKTEAEDLEAEGELVQVTKVKQVRLLPAVVEALNRAVAAKYIKSATFQVKSLEKRLATNTLSDEARSDIALLIAAKKNGEFSGAAQKEAAKQKSRKGGFEKVSRHEMVFYAAVDADATRRIAFEQMDRMLDEDEKLARWRDQVADEISFAPPGSELSKYKVKVLYPDENPLKNLLQMAYLPRQVELGKIEYNGVKIDQGYLEWGAKALDNTISSTTNKVYELCGETFKIGSSKKLASYLFEGGVGYVHPDPKLAQEMADKNPGLVRYVGGRIMYRSRHYTEKGQMQTSEAVLKHLVMRYQCPLANLIMSLKKADKARNSFFKNIGILSNMFGDGKIHPNYNLNGTSTGRLSSSSGVVGIGFNNQNIPKGNLGALRDSHGKLILGANGKPLFEGVKCKNLFIPDDESMCFGNADAKGAEVSIFAGYAMDEALINALIGGMDAHCFFASQCLNPDAVAGTKTGADRQHALALAGIDDEHAWSYEDFLAGKDDLHPDKVYGKRLKALRDNIKRLVFGLLFGAGIKKIADIAGIDLVLAQTIRDMLFTKFPTLEAYMEQTKWEMRMFQIVETYHGRRRRFSIKNAPNSLRAKAERQAVNFKIQGTNSDIVLSVLCWVAPVIERDLRGRLLGTVHDSIMFQVPKKYAHQVPAIFKEYGTDRVAKACPWLPVPYRWDVELGANYGSVMPAAKYIAGLPPEITQQLDGCTEEEVFEDLRNPDEVTSAPRSKGFAA